MSKKPCGVKKRLHKALLCTALTVAVISCSGIGCRAQESYSDVDIEGIISDFADAIPEGMDDVSSVSELTETLGVKRVISDVIAAIKGSADELGAFIATLIGIAMMSALSSLSDGELSVHISRAVGVVSSALLFERLAFLISDAVGILSELNGFFAAVIPISLAVNSLGASPTTATTQAMGMGLTLGAYSFISERVLGGAVGAIFISAALAGVDPMLSHLSKSVKGVFLGLIGAMTALLGGTFALQSTISASADTIAVRSARYAVSSTIPIVGNAISGALGLLGGGVSYARGIVGGGAIAVVISLVVSPLVTLLAYRLCMKLGECFCSRCSLNGCEGVIGSFVGALDALIAVYALTSIIYIIELAAFLKGGAGLA